MQPGGTGLGNSIDPFANAGVLEDVTSVQTPVMPSTGPAPAPMQPHAAVQTVQVIEEPAVDLHAERGPKALLHFNKLALGVTLAATAVVVIVGVAALAFSGFKANDQGSASSKQPASDYDVKNLAAVQSSTDLLDVTKAAKLSINGELQVGSTFVLTPTGTPSTPKAGQIYYNRATNTPFVYNGSEFVSLTDQPDVDSIGGVSGSLGLGSGLQVVGNQLNISSALQQSIAAKVTTLQGQTGDVSLIGGTGISVNGTTISNTGVIRVLGLNGILVAQNSGEVSVSLPQPLSTTSSPSFASMQLTNSLGLASGGTNANGSTYQMNGMFYFNGTGFATTSTPSTSGLCLLSGPSGPFFGSCSESAAAGVASITGSATGSAALTGSVIFNNAVTTDNGTVKVVTINDASLTESGLISTGAQTIAGVKTFVDDVTVNGTVNANAFIGNGSGVTNVNAARLNGQSAAFYLNASNINDGALSDAHLSTNVPLKDAATNTFTGNIVAVGVSATTLIGDGAGVTNVDAISLGGNNAAYYRNASNINAGTLADTRLSTNVPLKDATENIFAGTVTATSFNGSGVGLTNVNAAQLNGQAASYYLNASNLSSGTLLDARLSTNVALKNAATVNFTGTLQQDGNDVCTSANNCNYLTGSAASGTYIQLQGSTPGTAQTGNFNITGTGRAAELYQNGFKVCDESGNCNGLGGELTGAGTPGTIAMFTGTGSSLSDSLLSQASSTVTVGGTLAAVNLTGNGSGVTNVNASQLGGQLAGYYVNAGNLSTGTLPDARLSSSVALYSATIANFTGTLQQDGNNVCTAANNCGYLTGSSASGSYIQLQATTPGTAQVGNMNISGAAIAASFAGGGAGLTDVNAVALGGENSAYYRNASNLNAGTLLDARLSTNVALKDATTVNFTGTLQQGGNNVCTAANNCGYLTGAGASGSYVQLQATTPGTAQTGHLNITGSAVAATFVGDGADVTNVNAIALNGQDSTYYRNATNLNAGTLADLRLSTNVALKNATTVNFTGTLQQGGNNVCTAANNCNYLTGSAASGTYIQLQATDPGTAQTGNFNIDGIGRATSLYQNGNQVCDTSGNCNGVGGFVSGTGTGGTIAVFTGSGTIGNSLLTQASSTVTVAGTLAATNLTGNGSGVTNVNAAQLNSQSAGYYLNAGNLNAGTLLDARLSTNVALKDVTANFTGALQQGGNNVCTTANNCNYLTGTSANGSYIQLQVTSPGTAQTGNFNIDGIGRAATLYQGANQVCDTSGNCVGVGGELTGSGTAGTIALFTGAGTSLGDSILSQSSGTLTVAGNLTATNLTGNGSGVTNVNASQLGSQSASYYLNASNLGAGTLADARLSSSVALYGATVANFTGTLQQGGNNVCTSANNCNFLTQLTANDIYIQLQPTASGTAQTGNMNISGTVRASTIYQGANQVCDTSGNCNGATGVVTGSGTAGTIPVFTGTGNSLDNSLLSQNLSTVTVAGTLAATNLSGNGSSVTNVNAAQLGGQAASYYLNASNLSTGTLLDARLSSNVARRDIDNTFGGVNTFSTTIYAPDIQSTSALNITGGTTLNVQSTGTNAATFDSGTTGNVNIGTGANQKAITIGNSTFATSLNLLAGTGGVTIGSAGVANTIQIGNTTGAVAQSINIGNNLTASSSTTITMGSLIGTSPVTVYSGTNGVTFRGANSTTAFNVQDASLNSLLMVNSTNSVVGVGGAPSASGAKLQVTGAITATGDLTTGGRVYAGQSGVNVISGGTTSQSVLYGDGSKVILQNVTLATNSTVKVGTSMGVLYVDGSGNLQVLSVTGQSGNCVNYNGTTVTWSGCSGSGGGGTSWANGGNAYTTNPGTATSRYAATYDATITNPVFGLQGANALDIITNNYSRIRIGETGDVAVLSNGPSGSAESTTKFTVRTYNDGNVEQYINTLVVDTTATGNDYGGRVGIGLKIATAPQVTLDIGGGRNNYGGSGIQVRASAAPGLSISGTQGEGTASTGRIYYDQQLRKFRVSENGGAYTDLVVGGGGNPFLVGGNAMNGTAAVFGTTDNSALNIQQGGNNRIVFDQGGNIKLTAGTNYSVLIGANATTQSNVALNVDGRILATEYASGGYVGSTIGPCNSNQAMNGMRVVAGLVVAGTCATNNSDLAEAYNSSDALVPGELVMSTTEAATSVKRATATNNEGLMGIVSTAPGKLIGTEQVPNGYPIALSGRVPTKVNTEGGAIAVGDKITISSVPGVGKKATGAGMIVGTAVESFSGSGTGVIEVFVNLTYYEPTNLDMLQAQTAQFGDLNVSGTATINNLTVTGLASVKNIKISGHIITASGQPTTEVQAAAGAGATVTVNGNDTTGTITITTGSAAVTGEMVKIVFSELYGEAPHVVLSPSNAAAARVSYFKGTTSVESFMLNFDEAPAANATYTFDYFISQ